MSDLLETTTEIAKAVQETAKATQSLVEAGTGAGKFLAPYIREPLKLVSRLVEEKILYARAMNYLKFQERFEREVQAIGAENLGEIPLKFALAALEEGVLEEHDDLQDIWARLLANAADAQEQQCPRRAHISMLKDMTALDALVFETIYSVPDTPTSKAIVTYELPKKAYGAEQMTTKEAPEPNEEIKISLSNLERIGVIAFGSSWGGAEIFRYANKTTAGRELMKAIRRRSSIEI